MKSKILVWILAFFLLPFYSVSQSYRRLTLSIEPGDKAVKMPSSVYLMSDDKVLFKSLVYENRASFCIDESIKDCDTYIAFRQKHKGIERIRFDYLKNSKNVSIAGVVLALTNDSIVLDFGLEKHERVKGFVSIEETKLWLDFTPENQRRLSDTVRWFFPTELLYDVESHKKYIADSIYQSNYKRDFGRYPTAKETDSLSRRMAFNTAESIIGWYSWHLSRLQETELCNDYREDIYRFTMVSNFRFYTHEPCSFRIEHSDDGRAVLYCSYEKRNEYETELYCDVYPMNEKVFSEFLAILEKDDFWDACPNVEPASLAEKDINYILEANVKGKYHVIFRGEGEDPALDELQRFLWDLTGLGENKIVHRRQRIE